MTITEQQQKAIRRYFAGRNIPAGLGDENSACSIGGINVALFGQLNDVIPPCMSEQIGHWMIRVQDAMGEGIRNSDRWRNLLPLAAGTGRQHEERRTQMILEWMWETVLPYIQSLADEAGYGDEWRAMCETRTEDAAAKAAAADAADAADAAYVASALAAYVASYAKPNAAHAAEKVAGAAAYAASTAANAAHAAEKVAGAAAYAASTTANAAQAYAAAWKKAWDYFNPCSLLERLIEVSEEEK